MIRSRPYASDDADLGELFAFTQACCQQVAPASWDFHVGDLIWHRYVHDADESRFFERVQIWEDNQSEILGYAIYHREDQLLCPLVRPDQKTNTPLIESMIEWGEERLATLSADGDPTTLNVEAFGGSSLEATLIDLGWQPTGDGSLLLFDRSLEQIPVPRLPAGFVVRPLTGPDEYADRVAIHREAFDPSKFTLSAYQLLRDVAEYDPDLDLVAVAPDGTFAAYCITWFDPVNRTGFFEPVGARAAFRRQGLTQATLFTAMHRLAEMGATKVMVCSYSDTEPAQALYRSAGFALQGEWRSLRRQ